MHHLLIFLISILIISTLSDILQQSSIFCKHVNESYKKLVSNIEEDRKNCLVIGLLSSIANSLKISLYLNISW